MLNIKKNITQERKMKMDKKPIRETLALEVYGFSINKIDAHVMIEPDKPEGCPCGDDCCDNPSIGCPEHECEDNDGICEDCYSLECDNCDKSCCCNI